MAQSLAWRGQVDHCESGVIDIGGDSQQRHLYSMCLVVPFAVADPMTLAEAEAKFGDFILPHAWTITSWSAYSGVDRIADALLLPEPVGPDGPEKITERIETAIRQRVNRCPDVFRLDKGPVDLKGDATLLNAMAGLVHWPAGLSGHHVLKRTFLVAIADKDLAGKPLPNDVIVLPDIEFKLRDGSSVVWKMPQQLPQAGKVVHDLPTGVQVQIEMQVGRSPGATSTPPALVATQTRATPLVVREALASSLNPIALFRRAIERFRQDIDTAEKATPGRSKIPQASFRPLRICIPRTLGAGWGVPYTGAGNEWKKPYILASLPGARDVLEPAANPFPHRVDIERERLARLLGIDPSDPNVALLFADQMPKPPMDPNAVLDAWIACVTRISAKDTYIAQVPFWLAFLGDIVASTDPAKRAEWAVIRAQLTSANPTGLNRLAIAERNATGALALLGRDKLPAHGDPELKDLLTAQRELVRALEQGQAADPERKRLAGIVAPLLAAEAKELLDSLDPANKALLEASIAMACVEGVDGFAKLLEDVLAVDRVVAKDEGLHLVFEADIDETRRIADQQMRGYALALRAGIKPAGAAQPKWDDSSDRWITDTQLSLSAERADLVTTKNGKQTFWFHEGVGSSIDHGHRVVATMYNGHPLLSTPYKWKDEAAKTIEPEDGKDVDFDGFNEVEFLWPRWQAESKLPPMAFGAAYQGIAATLGNAGDIREAEFRVAGSYTALKPAKDCFADSLPVTFYRSREKLDAPRVVGLDSAAYEMSEETRAASYYARIANSKRKTSGTPERAVKVALLTRDDFWDRQHSATLTAYPPRAGMDFIAQWLDADCLRAQLKIAEPKGYSHKDFNDGHLEPMKDFRDAMVEKMRRRLGTKQDKPEDPSDSYHPAFGAYGLRIVFNDGHGGPAVPDQVYDDAQVTWNGTAFLQKTVGLTLKVKAADANGFNPVTREVSVAPGSFVKVSFFSLVDETLVNGADSLARFHTRREFTAFKDAWLSCEGADFYFEAAPQAPAANPVAEAQLEIAKPQAGQAEKIRVALRPKAPMAADWIREFDCYPHDFHWTGYPIEFPEVDGSDGKTLAEKWLVPHADTHSERRDLQAKAPVGTFFDAGDPAKWHLGAEVSSPVIGLMERGYGSEERPAHHTIYVARPVVRFRKWLKKEHAQSPLKYEKWCLGASAVVPGIAPDLAKQRLTVPPVIGDFPMVATYVAGKDDRPSPTTNGVLLVIDEAIQRTDERAKVGGVGDTLEVDVLSSRGIEDSAGKTAPSWRQIGPNPIFERAPEYTTPKDQPSLESKPPFGLTYDISSNGLVSQTAFTVLPQNAKGQWLMAQVRVRRWIEPELLLGTQVEGGRIPLRAVGEEMVPLDFVVEGEAGVKELSLESVKISLEADAFSPPLKATPGRFLVSWHKGRWRGGGNPTWRVQVLAQERIPGMLGWNNVGKSDCTRQAADLPKLPVTQRLVLLTGTTKPVRLVPMSDYSASRWLFFIGDFFKGAPVGSDRFELQSDANGRLTLKAQSAPLPECIPLSGDTVESHWLLVYRPVRDLMRGLTDKDAGALIGAWKSVNGAFERLPADSATSVDLKGCYAYLCTFQCASARTPDETQELLGITSTRRLFELMFPDTGAYLPESTREPILRLVPKVLGPIPIEPKP